MPARKSAAPAEMPGALDRLSLLRLVAGEEMFAAALPLLRARMKLTPEKLALILLRELNPDARIEQGEEATIRGVKAETLRDLKEAPNGVFKREINGVR